jgi:hypothetical protein
MMDELAKRLGVTLEELHGMECTIKQINSMTSFNNKSALSFIQFHKVKPSKRDYYRGQQYRNVYSFGKLLKLAAKSQTALGEPYDGIAQENILDNFQTQINERQKQLALLVDQIIDKEITLKRINHSINVSGKQLQQTLNDPLLDEDEILLLAGIRRLKCGIYFLIKDQSVVYVGQSINITQRVAEHTKTKDFDTFTYVQCKRENLNQIEAMYITRLKPKYNYNSLGRLQLPMAFTQFMDVPLEERAE